MKEFHSGLTVIVTNTKYPHGSEGTIVDYSPDRGLVRVKMRASGKNETFLESDVEKK